MATFEIPLDVLSEAYEAVFDLEGEGLTFEVRYSRREDAWYLTAKTSDGVVVFDGEKVLASWPLGLDQNTILGSLITLDEEASGVPPRADELGARVKLFYVESGG